MKSKIILAIVVVVLVLGALAGIKTLQFRKMMAAGKNMTMPPETIAASVVKQETWPLTLTAIASVTAAQGVTITPDLPGTVREIAFESGAVVKAGDVLVRLDTSTEEAQLRSIKAQFDLARLNFERVGTLRRDDMVAQADLDSADATMKQFQANADEVSAIIAKKTIKAPFAGPLGIRQINLGQYLEAGKPIVSLQALSPIFADFALPQQELAKLRPGMQVNLATDAYPGRQFEGRLTAINPELSTATRSVGLQASFENTEQLLRAGMFGRVEVMLTNQQPVLVIPSTAILSAPYGDSVFILENQPAGTNGPAHTTVSQHFIRTGRPRGDFVSVESGLKGGERIASAGLFKLRNGSTVVENNEMNPKPSATPRPPNT
jgi:membrane fusion protein (multidrug efflux system)